MNNNNSTSITEQELNTRVSVLDVKEGTMVDGVGLRTSIYFAGCSHHCEGCHNPQSWDIKAGHMVTVRELLDIVEENDFNVTFSGGDPLAQVDELTILARAIKQRYGKTIWCYTGYTLEQVKADEHLSQILDYIDVIVDGRFVLAQRDTELRFRGSRNQRIIDIHNGEKTLYNE